MRVAVLSVHGCPLLAPGSRDAGGMNVYVSRVGQEMAERGVEVDVYTRWHDAAEPQVARLHPNLRVIHLAVGKKGPVPKEELFPLLPQFVAAVEDFAAGEGLGYDVLHSHYWLSGWAGVALARRWRLPHVTMFHTLGAVKNQSRVGEQEPEQRILSEAAVVAAADAVVVASREDSLGLLRNHPEARGKLHLIPCGVDVDLFRPLSQAEARRHLGLNGERILLFVGRPDPLKGLEILLSAAALLEHPAGIRVLVVGGDGAAGDPDGGAAQVSYMGQVNHQLLPYYYNAADVCVIPSYYESFGMVALEAMACGVPVVAARVGGLQSTVRDGETGYLIPWHCPEPFAERLELLLGNETLRVTLGQASHAAAQAYRWSAVADSLLDLYATLVEAQAREDP